MIKNTLEMFLAKPLLFLNETEAGRSDHQHFLLFHQLCEVSRSENILFLPCDRSGEFSGGLDAELSFHEFSCP